jgi:hypothetical protein
MVVLSAAALPTQASNSANASLGPLTVQLIDLDPADGIAPAVTFQRSGFDEEMHAIAVVSRPHDEDYQSWTGRPWEVHGVSATAGAAQAHVAVNGSGEANGANFALMGSAGDFFSPSPADYIGFNGYVGSPFPWVNYFALSANTRIVFTAQISLDATAKCASHPYAGVSCASSYTGGGIGAGILDGPMEDDFSYFEIVATPDSPFASVAVSRLLTVSFENVSSGDLSGGFQMWAGVGGISSPSMVPEAGTWAMFTAGLALAGVAARRSFKRKR